MADNDELLVFAVVAQNLECFKERLALGPDVHFIHPYHGSALMQAAHRDQIEIAKLLLNAGADINVIGPHGKSALEHARSDEMRGLFLRHLYAKRDLSPAAHSCLPAGFDAICRKVIDEAWCPGLRMNVSDMERVEKLTNRYGFPLPAWYRDLQHNYDLVGLRFDWAGFPEASETMEFYWGHVPQLEYLPMQVPDALPNGYILLAAHEYQWCNLYGRLDQDADTEIFVAELIRNTEPEVEHDSSADLEVVSDTSPPLTLPPSAFKNFAPSLSAFFSKMKRTENKHWI